MMRAVFFDLGGTLLDISAWNSDEAYSYDLEVLQSLGSNLTIKQCKNEFMKARKKLNEMYKGSPKRHQTGLVFSTVCESLGLELDPRTSIETDYKILTELIKSAKLADNAIETLKLVKSKGLKTALLCNGSIMRTNLLIDRFGLRDFFDVIIISEEVGYEKSTGIPFKAALRKLSLQPDQAVMVGDNPEEDLEGAKKAGIKSVLSNLEGLPRLLASIR